METAENAVEILALVSLMVQVGVSNLEPNHYCEARQITEHCSNLTKYYGLDNEKCINVLSGNKLCKSGWTEIHDITYNLPKNITAKQWRCHPPPKNCTVIN